jgi:hypothetical protein
VEWIREHGYKAVAIGCGGYLSWSGGFTLLLLDDNRLFCCGRLGSVWDSAVPVQVGEKEFEGRHVLSREKRKEGASGRESEGRVGRRGK